MPVSRFHTVSKDLVSRMVIAMDLVGRGSKGCRTFANEWDETVAASVSASDAQITDNNASLHPSTMAASKGKAPATNDIPYELPWYVYRVIMQGHELKVVYGLIRVEKYRPKILDDIVGNSETIERLKVIARDGNCPHIIISVRRF